MNAVLTKRYTVIKLKHFLQMVVLKTVSHSSF